MYIFQELSNSKDIDNLYKDISKSFVSLTNSFQHTGYGWTPEEMLYVEIEVVRKLYNEQFFELGYNNNNRNVIKLKKTGIIFFYYIY